MGKQHCEFCKCILHENNSILHHIVPEEIAKQAGLHDLKTVRLCLHCCNEVMAWYNERVSSNTYDWMAKHFVPKSAIEMVKEYETAYEAFIKYRRLL